MNDISEKGFSLITNFELQTTKMRNYLIITIAVFVLAGCSKEKFKTTPDISFKTVNTTELQREQLIRFTLSFTDKEGDVSDSIFVQKVVPNCPDSEFEQYFPMPAIPESGDLKGDIVFTLGYNVTGYYDVVGPRCMENDTATFRFALRDKKGHISDTVSSPKIIIYQ